MIMADIVDEVRQIVLRFFVPEHFQRKLGWCAQCGRNCQKDTILCSQVCALHYWKKFRDDVKHRKLCGYPGCEKDCYVENNGRVHDYCNRTHDEQHKALLEKHGIFPRCFRQYNLRSQSAQHSSPPQQQREKNNSFVHITEGSSKMDQQDNDPSPLEGSSNTGQQDNDPSPLEGSSNTGQQDNDPEGSSNTGQQDNDPEGSSNTGQQDNDPSPLEGSSNTDQRGIKRGLCVQCGRKYWNDEILCSQPCRLQYWKKCRVDVYHDKLQKTCGYPGCIKDCYLENNGCVHEYCNAEQHKALLEKHPPQQQRKQNNSFVHITEGSSNTDQRGIKRGRCTVTQCDCSQFVSSGPTGKMGCCRPSCGHPPGRHQNISSDGSSALVASSSSVALLLASSADRPGSAALAPTAIASPSKLVSSSMSRLDLRTSHDRGGPYTCRCAFHGCSFPALFDVNTGVQQSLFCDFHKDAGSSTPPLSLAFASLDQPLAAYNPPTDIITITELKAGSQEYTRVESHFKRSWAREKGHCPKVDHILTVRNTKLERKLKRYRHKLKNKGSPTNVEEHYHGTSIACDLATTKAMCSDGPCGVCGVSKSGFKKTFIQHNVRFMRFGKGFYLAPNSSKCHDYTQGCHMHRAILLCDVVPGNKYVLTKTDQKLPGPPQGYDSVYGKTGQSLNYEELVLYCKNSILPKYVIMYQRDGVHKIAK